MTGVMKKIFGLKRDGVMGGWRYLHNEQLPFNVILPSYYIPRKL
jgi:hypothetical protein